MKLPKSYLKFALLLIAGIIASLSTLFVQVYGQVHDNLDRSENLTKDPRGGSLIISWDDLTETFLSKPPRTGKGPKQVCPILPLATYQDRNIFTQNPLFVWQDGEAHRIEVRDQETEEIVWNSVLPEGVTKINYNSDSTGKTLQFGTTYEWLVFDVENNPLIVDSRNNPNYQRFTLLDETQSNTITQDLDVLKNQMISQGKNEDEIALSQVNYLVEKSLLSDALRIAFSVKQPSAELQDSINKIVNNFCPSSDD
jgi:hypothetical protein